MGKTNDFNLVYHISRIVFPDVGEEEGTSVGTDVGVPRIVSVRTYSAR